MTVLDKVTTNVRFDGKRGFDDAIDRALTPVRWALNGRTVEHFYGKYKSHRDGKNRNLRALGIVISLLAAPLFLTFAALKLLFSNHAEYNRFVEKQQNREKRKNSGEVTNQSYGENSLQSSGGYQQTADNQEEFEKADTTYNSQPKQSLGKRASRIFKRRSKNAVAEANS